jgi:hypothetical protein
MQEMPGQRRCYRSRVRVRQDLAGRAKDSLINASRSRARTSRACTNHDGSSDPGNDLPENNTSSRCLRPCERVLVLRSRKKRGRDSREGSLGSPA